jgi:hypothetical protein
LAACEIILCHMHFSPCESIHGIGIASGI